MSTIDLGAVSDVSQLAQAVERAATDGKRVLIAEDGVDESGETRYRLSAESQFSRLIRNVKAFFTGGNSGYDHDQRVQSAFHNLIAKGSRQAANGPEQHRLQLLDARIAQLDGHSISGNAAKVFSRLHKESTVPFGLQTFDNVVYDGRPSSNSPEGGVDETVHRGGHSVSSADPHDYEEIPDYDYSDVSNSNPRQTPGLGSDDDYDYPGNPGESVALTDSFSGYELPVPVAILAGTTALQQLPSSPDAVSAPKIGRTQLRESQLGDAALLALKGTPELQESTDADFRASLKFPEHTVTRKASDGSSQSVAGTVSAANLPVSSGGFYLALLANTVETKYVNRLGLLVGTQEFNARLAQALAHEDNSDDSVAGESLKGTKAADVIIAAKVLDELLREQEDQELQARDQVVSETARYERLAEEIQKDLSETFTSLEPSTRVREEEYDVPVRPEPNDDPTYARLSEISTQS